MYLRFSQPVPIRNRNGYEQMRGTLIRMARKAIIMLTALALYAAHVAVVAASTSGGTTVGP